MTVPEASAVWSVEDQDSDALEHLRQQCGGSWVTVKEYRQ
jgi:hypothetical protein